MIDFDAATHTYRDASGNVLPGVTRVIEPLEQFHGVAPSVLEYAAERGRDVHLACEYLDAGDLDESSLDDEVRGYVDAYRRFVSEARPTWIAVECRVWSEQYRYAGTADRVGDLHGLRSPRAATMIVELKTVSSVSPVTALQLAGYEQAYRETFDPRRRFDRCAVQLRRDGTYKYHRYDEATDLAVFLAQLSISQWCARHGKQQEIRNGT